MIGSNEQGQGKRHHKKNRAIGYCLCAPLFLFFFIHYFSFFSQPFFCSYTFDIFFQQGGHKNKLQKM